MASESETEHLEDLRILFNGLVVNSANLYVCTQINFLAHHITRQGTIPSCQEVKAVIEFPKPINIKGLQESVGMLNFYNRLLPIFCHYSDPSFPIVLITEDASDIAIGVALEQKIKGITNPLL